MDLMENVIPIETSKVAIEVVHRETVKPLTPTPDHLKKFGISVHDQIATTKYMPIVFFYPAGREMCAADRTRRLKESLSETLVRFYPVAGRVVKEEAYVDCNDSGVDFLETKVKGCCLADILRCPDNEVMSKLFPRDISTGGPGHLMGVQSNLFECGGMAVGACFAHLIMDACGRSAFLKDWAEAARGDARRSPPPDLGAIASHFPALPNIGSSGVRAQISPKCVLRRFVFDSDKITSLKDRIASASGVRPTRVEALTAFIYRCMVNSLTIQLGHEARPSLAFQAINLRRKFDPPFPETSLGNMAWTVFAESGNRNEFVNDPPSIIAQFKKGMRDLTGDCATKLTDSTKFFEAAREVIKLWRDDLDLYFFSSLCGFGLYESDFGWGKPVWISIPNTRAKNNIIMIDARESGAIETWITLREEHMTFFETNSDLLKFASLNPS